jgi:SAM-dependent methyltransferase
MLLLMMLARCVLHPRAAQVEAADMAFILDIGGEGRHHMAWNLNPRPHKTLGPQRGRPIPRLILGRAEAIPLPDASVDHIYLERAPLTRAGLCEIARVIRPGGRVVLRHVAWPGRDRHLLAKQLLCGLFHERHRQLWGRTVQESTIHVKPTLPCGAPTGRANPFCVGCTTPLPEATCSWRNQRHLPSS